MLTGKVEVCAPYSRSNHIRTGWKSKAATTDSRVSSNFSSFQGLSAFQGSRLSNTNVYQDRLQVRDGQSRIEECAAQGRLKGVEVLQRRPGPKDVRTCHVSCYRVLKEDEEAEHELELEE